MKPLVINTDFNFEETLNAYPEGIKERIDVLRSLILEVAVETDTVEDIQETLKWGEPSFLTKFGSTLRMDWKPQKPNQYALFFQCSSKLVATFKDVFGPIFRYDKNRAIYFDLDKPLPVDQLKQVIRVTLEYHKVKQKENLGL